MVDGEVFFGTKFWFFLKNFYKRVVWSYFFSRTRRAMLGEAFRYLEHLHATSENFSRATLKKLSAENGLFRRFASEYSEN